MEDISKQPNSLYAKIGASLFTLWSVLHIWVGVAGFLQFLGGDVKKQWDMLIGGVNVPKEAFQHATDAITQNAHAHLIANFCLDVGGYGVLGLFVAWMIWARGSWVGYIIGVVAIGIADLSFLFLMVTPGIIEANLPTISGPIIWFLAISGDTFRIEARSIKDASTRADQNARISIRYAD